MSSRNFVFSFLLFTVACAGAETDDVGGGDTGGSGGLGGAGGQGGGAGGTEPMPVGGAGGGSESGGADTGGEGGVGGGVPSNCGNGTLDPEEQCEGSDFGELTCEDFNLTSGQLVCNGFCTIVVSSCVAPELCNDGLDNDLDFATDCEDDDCVAAASCLDSCAGSEVVFIPDFVDGTFAGQPDTLVSSCAPSAGQELVYVVQIVEEGDLAVRIDSGGDTAISVRQVCGDDTTEIACANNSPSGDTETLSFPTVVGATYYVILESDQANDFFFGEIFQPQPETSCNNLFDDDSDGYLDCDDETNCKAVSSECDPGALGYGENCFSHDECNAVGGDPVCLGFDQGFDNGYCSEFCEGEGDCPGGGVCMDIGLSVHGVCFKSCLTPNDCPGGNDCVDNGSGQLICDKQPELNCQDYDDNDFDGLVDCEDPTACASSFSCTPGPAPAGNPCQIHGQCAADANDPYCIDQSHEGWPGGYCSQFCELDADDCPVGSTCADLIFFPSGAGLCMKSCELSTDCRPGYNCSDFGFATNICVF